MLTDLHDFYLVARPGKREQYAIYMPLVTEHTPTGPSPVPTVARIQYRSINYVIDIIRLVTTFFSTASLGFCTLVHPLSVWETDGNKVTGAGTSSTRMSYEGGCHRTALT